MPSGARKGPVISFDAVQQTRQLVRPERAPMGSILARVNPRIVELRVSQGDNQLGELSSNQSGPFSTMTPFQR